MTLSTITNSKITEGVPEGVVLFRREDPSQRFWIPIKVVKTYKDLKKVASQSFNDPRVARVHMNDDEIPGNVWEDAAVPGATFGISFYTLVKVRVNLHRLPAPPIELNLNLTAETSILELKRKIWSDTANPYKMDFTENMFLACTHIFIWKEWTTIPDAAELKEDHKLRQYLKPWEQDLEVVVRHYLRR